MKVIALAQQKGGVAKSTLAINLAVAAHRGGVPTVIIELDRQGTSSTWAAARAEAGLGKPDVMQLAAHQLEQTLRVIQGLGVKLAILDLPGAHNPAINAAIKAADLVLLPSRPQETDVQASAEPLAVVQRLRKAYAYVMTFVEPSAPARAKDAARDLTEAGHRVVPQFIFRRQEYVDAVVAGKGTPEIKSAAKAAGEVAGLLKWITKELDHEHREGRAQSA